MQAARERKGWSNSNKVTEDVADQLLLLVKIAPEARVWGSTVTCFYSTAALVRVH
jgi:hypothetical protein